MDTRRRAGVGSFSVKGPTVSGLVSVTAAHGRFSLVRHGQHVGGRVRLALLAEA